MMISPRFSTPIQIRFRDTDALGHVNNAVYHSWIEYCRTHWLDTFLGCGIYSQGNPIPIILARSEIDFLKEVHLKDELIIETWISHVGQKSFHQSYEIKRASEIVAKSKAVLVWFDFAARTSVELPEELRAKLLKHLE